MTAQHVDPVVARLRAGIDRIADAREAPRDPSMGQVLGPGYYSSAVRDDAARLAAGWVSVAHEFGVTLDDLNLVTDIACGALDAVQAARRRSLREAHR